MAEPRLGMYEYFVEIQFEGIFFKGVSEMFALKALRTISLFFYNFL